MLVERAGRVAEGIAYSTTSKRHLLNVPARSMSAFQDDPGHFVRWLAGRGLPGAADEFMPRALYGRYLRETLWPQGEDGASPRLGTVLADVVDVTSGPQGHELVLDTGHTIAAKAVVLSTGTLMRQFPASLCGATSHPRCIANPWAHDALAGIPPSATVTLLGSGLTAIDVLLALQESGHRGPVHAISRHGLLPRAHKAAAPGSGPWERLCRDLEGSEVRSLLHQVRQIVAAPQPNGAEAGGAEAGGADWRDMVDALRPEIPRLWSRLSGEEQLRFRRHLERFWNVYRHRMAPPVAQAVDELQSSGIFFVHAGAVDAVEEVGATLHLQVKLRARPRPYAWRTDWLVNCTGPDPHLFERGQPLMDALLTRGLAGPAHRDGDRHRRARARLGCPGTTVLLALGGRATAPGPTTREHGGAGDPGTGGRGCPRHPQVSRRPRRRLLRGSRRRLSRTEDAATDGPAGGQLTGRTPEGPAEHMKTH